MSRGLRFAKLKKASESEPSTSARHDNEISFLSTQFDRFTRLLGIGTSGYAEVTHPSSEQILQSTRYSIRALAYQVQLEMLKER